MELGDIGLRKTDEEDTTCIAPVAMAPLGVGMPLPNPLTTPAVNVLERPYEFPMANTDCPTLSSDDLPSCSQDKKVIGKAVKEPP